MRLERLTNNKIKIFITFDDLLERGLTKEDVWHDSLKWRQLFHDMLEEANREFGVTLHGTIVVEVFSLQAQGMIMIITHEDSDGEDKRSSDDTDAIIDMHVTVDETEDVLFVFENLEDLILLAHRLKTASTDGGSLYGMDSRYFLYFDANSDSNVELIIPILAEYGAPSLTTIHRLKEYGKEIITADAIKMLTHYFK